MSRIINQFQLKRCKKKRKGLSYHLLLEFFPKYLVLHERSAVKNSFSTYTWSKVDSCFCKALYVALPAAGIRKFVNLEIRELGDSLRLANEEGRLSDNDNN